MNCKELAELLLEFVSGELETTYCQEIEEHLCICRECKAYVHSYKVTITISRKLPRRELPNSLQKRLENMLKEMQDG